VKHPGEERPCYSVGGGKVTPEATSSVQFHAHLTPECGLYCPQSVASL